MKFNKKIVEPCASFLYKVFRYALLIGISYVVLFPVIKMISSAFTPAVELYTEESGFLPSRATFENFKNAMFGERAYFNFLKYTKNTATIALLCTLLQVFSCSLVGYGLGRYNFKGNPIVYACVLFTIILPVQTAIIPLYYEYRWFDIFGIGKIIGLFTGEAFTVNILNNYMAFYVPALFGVGLNSGIYIFLLRQFFMSMPRDLEEAAKIDGCNPISIYLRIMIPNIKPVVVTVALLSVIYYWNDALLAGVFSLPGDDNLTLMVALEEMRERQGIGVSQLDQMRKQAEHYAIILTAVTPLMILFLIGQKFFVECMDRSGSKG
ncbi:MAG: carbohydrate ABC transporter permease [Oscillospiraceae bacterium]|nr:carbohydrate ABC transporter permease [Oscillospiraceae bacterium]